MYKRDDVTVVLSEPTPSAVTKTSVSTSNGTTTNVGSSNAEYSLLQSYLLAFLAVASAIAFAFIVCLLC